MLTGESGQFLCDACGRSYRWRAELSGRKVKCACGQVMIAPQVAPAEPNDLYDLAEPEKPQAAVNRVESVAVGVKPIDYQRPTTPGNSLTEQYFPDRLRDLYLPLGLIGGGLVVRFGYAAFVASRSSISLLPGLLAQEGLELLGFTALMLVGILIAAKFRKLHLGPLPVAVMKLCAVAIAPQAIVIMLGPLLGFIPFGPAIVSFAMFFALLGAMFDLDQSDTWYCWCVMAVIGIAGELAYMWWGKR